MHTLRPSLSNDHRCVCLFSFEMKIIRLTNVIFLHWENGLTIPKISWNAYSVLFRFKMDLQSNKHTMRTFRMNEEDDKKRRNNELTN